MRKKSECLKILAGTGKVDWNDKFNEWDFALLCWALQSGCIDKAKIIASQPNIDYNVKAVSGSESYETLADAAISGGKDSVEFLVAQDNFDYWNFSSNSDGCTPIMKALIYEEIEVVKILISCPKVDLFTKDKQGLSLEKMAR